MVQVVHKTAQSLIGPLELRRSLTVQRPLQASRALFVGMELCFPSTGPYCCESKCYGIIVQAEIREKAWPSPHQRLTGEGCLRL